MTLFSDGQIKGSGGGEVMEPGAEEGGFFGFEDVLGDEGGVAGGQVFDDRIFAGAEGEGFEGLGDGFVFLVAGDFVFEVFLEVVGVALLVDFGGVEGDALAEFPEAALGDEGAPDVGHSEGTGAGEVHEGEGGGEPPGGLAVEGGPGAGGEINRFLFAGIEIEGVVSDG